MPPKQDCMSSSSINALCSCPKAQLKSRCSEHGEERRRIPEHFQPDTPAHLPPNPSGAEFPTDPLKMIPSHSICQKAPVSPDVWQEQPTPNQLVLGCHVRRGAQWCEPQPRSRLPGTPGRSPAAPGSSVPAHSCLPLSGGLERSSL